MASSKSAASRRSLPGCELVQEYATNPWKSTVTRSTTAELAELAEISGSFKPLGVFGVLGG
jgi:hypothetical protein